ncbi:hotdog family protein [Bhargavaea beijingensis]|uniref:hypothetical protein n=1 Tax=Bhargavaea beijingensis TaxID=426756 RepID=UPI00222573BC|nr:hypothetical protein [Bhargavaea beijingensis]MCW1927381.1 hypothetical protein [Bhargavaea beijingensis]
MKEFIKNPKPPGRTLLKQDMMLFRELLGDQLPETRESLIDPRLTMMISIGLLNRTFDLESDLVAVLGQEWLFERNAQAGETLNIQYNIQKHKSSRKPVYLVKITLLGNGEVIGNGQWSLLLKRELEENVNV